MGKLYKIKFIKEIETCKFGDIKSASKKSAEDFVKNGYAEYVKEEPKKLSVIELEEPVKVVNEEPKELSVNEVKVLVSAWANDWNNSSMKADILDAIKQTAKRSNFNVQELKDLIQEEVKAEIIKKRGESKPIVKSESEKIEEPKKINPEIKPYLKWSQKFNCFFVDIDAVSKYLIRRFKFKTIYGKKTEVVWLYENGIWNQSGTTLIKVKTEDLLGSYAKNNIVQEVLGKIKRLTECLEEEFEKTDLYKIPILSGVWNINSEKLEEHSSDNNFKFVIPVIYVEGSDCPKLKKFLDETLYEQDIPLVQEWFGFCLFREYFIKKALIGKGATDTGKTTLINILIEFIGEKNKTGIPLQKLTSGNDFTKLSLKDKHLNVYDDLSFKDINDEGGFKIATGGGFISAEEKFGDYKQFKSFAKQMFMANQIPPAKNKDDMAYYSRYMGIEFDNIVLEKNPFLVQEILKEKSGIFNWALEGLKRLLKERQFSYKKTPEETRALMERSGNPLIQFAEECLEEDEKSEVDRDLMVEVYSLWAKEKDKQGKTKRQLGSAIPISIRWIINKRDSERTWGHVKIKKDWLDKIPNKNVEVNQRLDTLDALKNNMSNVHIYNTNIGQEIYVPKNPSNLSKEESPNISEQDKAIAEDFS